MANVEAHITGTIFKIEKKVGDPVKKEEGVIILESMKMEIPLESPIDGKVTEIKVKEGQAVDEGHVVAVVE